MRVYPSLIILLLISVIKTTGQQNWVAVSCFELKPTDAIGRIEYNPVQDELILGSSYSNQICGSTYKGFFAFNGLGFHDMDFGIEAQNPNPALNMPSLGECVAWNGKALITGNFQTVGADTLPSKYIASWNGSTWDTFPHPFWSNRAAPAFQTSFGMGKILRDGEKLWLFTGYDSAGTSTFIPYLFDGIQFHAQAQIPVTTKNQVVQAVFYHSNLVVTGNFLNLPSLSFYRLAQWDGTTWTELDNGAPGALTGVADLCVYNDTLYVAGNFSKADGCKGNYLMKWDGTQLLDAGFGAWCGYGAIRKLVPYRNKLYAFGGFVCAAGQKAYGVAYYENGSWTVPQDSLNNDIFDAEVYRDAIYIGGAFTSINGDSSLHHFVKLNCPTFDAASGCVSGLAENLEDLDLGVYPNPTSDKLFVEMAPREGGSLLRIYDVLGKEVYQGRHAEKSVELDLSSLSSGLYFLQVSTSREVGLFKFVKSSP